GELGVSHVLRIVTLPLGSVIDPAMPAVTATELEPPLGAPGDCCHILTFPLPLAFPGQWLNATGPDRLLPLLIAITVIRPGAGMVAQVMSPLGRLHTTRGP